jgi:ABC-type sugar transport system permease subunit
VLGKPLFWKVIGNTLLYMALTVPLSAAFGLVYALAMVGVWMSFGYNVILYISGLKQLDNEVKETAAIDGASGWQSFRHMTFPMLMPVHMFVWTITLLHSLQVFATVQIMTLGVPTIRRTSELSSYGRRRSNFLTRVRPARRRRSCLSLCWD